MAVHYNYTLSTDKQKLRINLECPLNQKPFIETVIKCCCYFCKYTTVRISMFSVVSWYNRNESFVTKTKLFIPWLFRSTAKTYYCSDAYQIVVSNCNVYIHLSANMIRLTIVPQIRAHFVEGIMQFYFEDHWVAIIFHYYCVDV